MQEPFFLKTVRLGEFPSFQEVISRKRHNCFLISETAITTLSPCSFASTKLDIDLFFSPSWEITGDSLPKVTDVYNSILSEGFMLCTPEMGLLAYPMKIDVQEQTFVAMEPVSDSQKIMVYSKEIPVTCDAKNKRIFTHQPVTWLDVIPYSPRGCGIGNWIFARLHEA